MSILLYKSFKKLAVYVLLRTQTEIGKVFGLQSHSSVSDIVENVESDISDIPTEYKKGLKSVDENKVFLGIVDMRLHGV